MQFKMPSLLYTQWLICTVCIKYMCVILNTDIGRALKYSTLLPVHTRRQCDSSFNLTYLQTHIYDVSLYMYMPTKS